MQRTTLSMPSSDDVTITGTSRNARSPRICSSTWKPSISGISISSSARSNGSRRSVSSATRPFSTAATRWPSNSRLRDSSRRLTLLSSTTSSRAPPPSDDSRMLQFRERLRNARGFAFDHVERRAGGRTNRVQSTELEVARETGERCRAERAGVRFERVRGTAKELRIACGERRAQLLEHHRSFRKERVDELTDELG